MSDAYYCKECTIMEKDVSTGDEDYKLLAYSQILFADDCRYVVYGPRQAKMCLGVFATS